MRKSVGLVKASFYFDGLAGVDSAAIASAGRERAQRNASILPDSVDQRLAVRITEMPVLPHQLVMAKSPKPFDFAYQLSAADAASLASMETAILAMGEALQTRIDRANAAVLVGKEIAITRGDGPICVFMPLRRLSTLGHEAFMHHWFDRHAALGADVEGVRYRQNHVDYAATEALAARMGLSFAPMDGLAESYFDSVEAAVALLTREDVAVGAIEDEKLFIDHDRSQFGLYETVWRN